jgi:hypothetical protein
MPLQRVQRSRSFYRDSAVLTSAEPRALSVHPCDHCHTRDGQGNEDLNIQYSKKEKENMDDDNKVRFLASVDNTEECEICGIAGRSSGFFSGTR